LSKFADADKDHRYNGDNKSAKCFFPTFQGKHLYPTDFLIIVDLLCSLSRARFTYWLYKLKPRASRSKEATSKLWYA